MSAPKPASKTTSAKVKRSVSKKIEDEVEIHSLSAENEMPDETVISETLSSETTGSSNDAKPRYYILKLTATSWRIKQFTAGLAGWFHTHIGGEARQEYNLFQQLNIGDIIIAFSGELNALYCQMKVTRGIHVDTKGEEKILFEVTSIFNNPINSDKLQSLPFIKELERGSKRLFQIDELLADTLLKASKDPSTIITSPPPASNYIGKEVKIAIPNYTTEGNHKETEDKLQFENDIESIAAVMSLKAVKPPLAIGLFGKWGSGKSFFMEKLYEKVDEFSRYENEDFVKNVVQVRFNSWHYTDSNLWASIVSEIFDSLNRYANNTGNINDLKKLRNTLSITTKQKELTEGRRQQLETNINHLQREQDEKRKKLEDLTALDLIRKVLSDKTVKEDLRKLKTEPVEKILANIDEVDATLEQLSSFSNKLQAAWIQLKESKGLRWFFIILFILFLTSAGTLLYQFIYNTTFVQGVISKAVLISSTCAGLMAYIIRFLNPVIRTFNEAVDRLTSVRKTLVQRERVQDAQLTVQKDELTLLTADIEQLNNTINSTKKEINDILSGSKLYEFIEQGSKNESYSKQLGLVSMIRKDFSRLDELLRMQHDEQNKIIIDNPLHVKLRIDRIILYIDDLDRCNEDIVLKVLEAIHLLLAFPLFVVVVGVDPRWLNNALNTKYKMLFGIKDNNNDQADDKNIASSYDYLEKIFQIPFCLKPITKDGRNDLIAYLLQREMEHQKKDEVAASKDADLKAGDVGKAETNVPKTNEVGNRSAQRVIEEVEESGARQEEMAVKIKALVNQLSFSADELKFMQSISAIYATSPRTIKRFVNIYRIIKTHKSIEVTPPFSKDDFAPVLILLSIVVGCSEEAEAFVKELQATEDKVQFDTFITSHDVCKKIGTKLLPYLDDEVKQLPVKNFKSNVELISRFSFRTLLV